LERAVGVIFGFSVEPGSQEVADRSSSGPAGLRRQEGTNYYTLVNDGGDLGAPK
jgi:hypothetical protein